MAVVSNSSPLIAFAAIEQLNLLPALFESVFIPPAVALEIAPSISTLPTWLRVQSLRLLEAERILLDDRSARRVALELNLLITGTAGILLVAKRHGLVPRIRPYLDALVEKSFFIGSDVYDDLLRLAAE